MDWTTIITIVLGSSVLGAVLNNISGWLIKKKENEKQAKFIALNLAHLFEKYTYECLTVSVDHENADSSDGHIGVYIKNIPKLAKFEDFNYELFELSLLDKIFDFPQQIEFAENNLNFSFEVLDGEDAVKEGHKSCLILAQNSINIADAIREKYELEKRHLKFGEYSVREQINERFKKYKINAQSSV